MTQLFITQLFITQLFITQLFITQYPVLKDAQIVLHYTLWLICSVGHYLGGKNLAILQLIHKGFIHKYTLSIDNCAFIQCHLEQQL